jgi:hypothetical protein
MTKFTKLEGAMLIDSLNRAMSEDMHDVQTIEESGKTPLFTVDYIQQTYVDLIGKVEEMTKKK